MGPINWRLVFWVSVPVGVIGTIWGIINLKDKGVRTPARIDWLGNAVFAIGLVALLVGIVYGIEPYGGHKMGWTSPWVLARLVRWGCAPCRVRVDRDEGLLPDVPDPFVPHSHLRGRQCSQPDGGPWTGRVDVYPDRLAAGDLAPRARLQLCRDPVVGRDSHAPADRRVPAGRPGCPAILSDHYGARPFATGGMIAAALSFGLLELLPIDFSYIWFASLIFVNGLAMGLFASPNRAAVMNSLPPDQRGQGSGMGATIMNSAMVLSIGIFFTLIIVGLSSELPTTLYQGLVSHGVPAGVAHNVANLPPTSSVFSAFLGYNPVESMLRPTGVLAHLKPAQAQFLTGRSFFPQLIARPFGHGLHEALDFALAACVVAAGASAMLGKRYVHEASVPPAQGDGLVGAQCGWCGGRCRRLCPLRDKGRSKDCSPARSRSSAFVTSPTRPSSAEVFLRLGARRSALGVPGAVGALRAVGRSARSVAVLAEHG